MLCYNFGLKCRAEHKYEQSVTWLKDSFELGKYQVTVSSKNQVREIKECSITSTEDFWHGCHIGMDYCMCFWSSTPPCVP